MQVTFTIEARVNYADPTKKETALIAVRESAVHLLASLSIILESGRAAQVEAFEVDWAKGGKKAIDIHEQCQVAIVHDDGFIGPDQLGREEDTLGKALKEQGTVGISAELLAALKK